MTKLICIICPRGCHLTIDENMKVSGNYCKRGENYAVKELTNPERTVTSTVKTINGDIDRVSVVTSKPIPKSKMMEVMEKIKKVEVFAPLPIGSAVIKNVLGLDVDVITTRELKEK